MNERIKELMKQAGTDSSGKWMGIEHAEKFAELIVRECIDIAGKEDFDVMMKEGYPCSQTAKKIREHFGVEPDVNENLRNRSTYFGNDI